jgi:hypothetical protein
VDFVTKFEKELRKRHHSLMTEVASPRRGIRRRQMTTGTTAEEHVEVMSMFTRSEPVPELGKKEAT